MKLSAIRVFAGVLSASLFAFSCSFAGNIDDRNLSPSTRALTGTGTATPSQTAPVAPLRTEFPSTIGKNALLLVEWGTGRLYLQDLDSGYRREIVFSEAVPRPRVLTWSGAGCDILLLSESRHIISVSIDGGRSEDLYDLSDLLKDDEYFRYSASSRGRYLAFAPNSSGILVLEGLAPFQIAFKTDLAVHSLGVWSHDESLLPYSAFDLNGDLQVYVLNIKERSIRQISELTNSEIRGVNIDQFAWDDADETLAFTTDNISVDTSGGDVEQSLWVYDIGKGEVSSILENSDRTPALILTDIWWTLERKLLLVGFELMDDFASYNHYYTLDFISGNADLTGFKIAGDPYPILPLLRRDILEFFDDADGDSSAFIRYNIITESATTFTIPYLLLHSWYAPPQEFEGELACRQ